MTAATVMQFVEDAKQDISSPSASVFPPKMAAYKNMVSNLDEVLDVDRNTTHRFKKCVKTMHTSAQTFIANELAYAENMEKLGSVALSREAETGIGTAFLKFSVITKELSQMTKTLHANFSNMVLFPLDSLLKGDMKTLGELKKPFDESWRELKAKGSKIEKESRKKTQEIILYRIDPLESSEETGKERKMFMYQSCEYLIKANEIKIKKGVELVQHLIEYYHAQLQYFHCGMELLENMRGYFDGLTGELQKLRQQQEDERKVLLELKTLLKGSMQVEKPEADKKTVYNIHGQQGDRDHGTEKRGNLFKRSEGVRKQWQKRHIVVKNGQFSMSHTSTSARTVTLNLLTCQAKPSTEKDSKKNVFALVTQNRTYLFQAEDENECEAWMSVITNAREEALKKAFGDGDDSLSKDTSSVATSLKELTEGIVAVVKRLPENDICVDCGAADPTWFSTNLGVLVCIECSGIHREMGVHISRIRSLTLDKLGTSELLLTKAIGNGGFNEIMEADLDFGLKPTPTSKMDQRKEFIHAKYIQKKFVHKTESPPEVLLQDLNQAVGNRDILAVLQLYAQGVDLSKQLPDYKQNGTALHRAVEQEDLTSLHIVDFLIQNSGKIDVQNADGNTALHIATILDKPECVKLLLRGGCNSNLTNNEGRICLAIATEKASKEIIELLKDVQEGRIQRLDNVKIDWGIDEADDIYENPLDILNDVNRVKSELANELPAEVQEKGVPVLPVLPGSLPSSKSVKGKSGGPVKRTKSLSSPPGPKQRSNASSPTLDKAFVYPDPGEKMPARPPPPPRKSVKVKGTPVLPAAAPIRPAKESKAETLGATATPLTTFAPKLTQPPSPAMPDKSPPPPTPPARTSSSLPRPDRPIAPPQVHQPRHQRNASDGGIIDALKGVMGQQQQQLQIKAKQKDAYEEIPELKPLPSSTPSSKFDLPPPRPPPRQKPSTHPPAPEPKAVKPPEPPQAAAPPASAPSVLAPSASAPPVSAPYAAAQALETTPATPPREPILDSKQDSRPKQKRARALYDCEADHDDELEFCEGDTIIIICEADPEWLYGEVEGKPGKRGVFPINFVHVLTN